VRYNDLLLNERPYIDRTYPFTTIPADCVGLTYIETANDDKDSKASNFLQFDISTDAIIYVAYDTRITKKPVWLSTWQDTGKSVQYQSLDVRTHEIYAKNFSKGHVVLGGNLDSGTTSNSNYFVMLRPIAGNVLSNSTNITINSTSNNSTSNYTNNNSTDNNSINITTNSTNTNSTGNLNSTNITVSPNSTLTILFDYNSRTKKALSSDNWPITWGDDDALYTAYGDGTGFAPYLSTDISTGFSSITGNPPSYNGTNIRSSTGEQTGGGRSGKKPSGMLMVNETLYMFERNANNNGQQCQLAVSNDHEKTWNWSNWKFAEFGYCAFLNFGKDNANARDNYVYMYSPDTPDAYLETDNLILARVPQDKIMDKASYEFYTGKNSVGNASWSSNINNRRAVFTLKGGVNRAQVSYNAVLKKYFLVDRSRALNGGLNQFSIYTAPEPWGPWSMAFYTTDYNGASMSGSSGWGESANFPTKWISSDGLTMYLVFSGDDSFSTIKATIKPVN